MLAAIVSVALALQAVPDRGPAAREVDSLLEQSQALGRVGKLAEATEVTRRAVTIAEARSRPDLYRSLDRLNDLLSASDPDTMLLVTDRMIAAARQLYGDEDFRTARAVTIRALFAGMVSGDNARLLREMPVGLADMTRLARSPEQAEEVATAAAILAKRLVVAGRDAEARTAMSGAIAAIERMGEPRSANAATAYQASADLLTGWGDYRLAEEHGLRALAIYERFDGPTSMELPVVLGSIARLKVMTGRPAEAEPLLVRALAIADAVKPPRQADLVRTLEDLGAFYAARGQPTLAEPLFRRAVTTSAQMPAGSDLAENALLSLASSYLQLGRVDDARTANAAAIARAESRDARSHKAGMIYLQAAQIALAAGDTAEAARHAARGRTLFETILPAGDPRRGDALAMAAEVAMRQGDRAAAAALWNAAATAMVPRGYPNASREAAAIRAAAAALDAGRPPDWRPARTAGDAMTRRLASMASLPASRTAERDEVSLYNRLIDVAWTQAAR